MYGSLFHIYCLGYVAWGKKKGKYWKKLISLKGMKETDCLIWKRATKYWSILECLYNGKHKRSFTEI